MKCLLEQGGLEVGSAYVTRSLGNSLTIVMTSSQVVGAVEEGMDNSWITICLEHMLAKILFCLK